MSQATIYGIKNCDTMKKAFKWLEENNVAYEFHDYKKQGVTEGILNLALDQHGWESLINRRGTTWRQLPDNTKNSMTRETAIHETIKNPSLIKRPLLLVNEKTHLGFSADAYAKIML